MLTVIILWAIGCSLIVYLNAKFWGLCPDTQDDEAQAKKRAVKPCIEPTKIPYWHKAMWVIDWIVCLCVAAFVVWLIFNAI